MDNLIKLIEIKCLVCYGVGVVIDRFDQSKREPCKCQEDDKETNE